MFMENMEYLEGWVTHLLLSLLLLFLLLLCSLGGTSSGSTGTSSRGGSGTTTRANVQKKVLDVLALKSLGEEGSPYRLDVRDLCSTNEGVELVGL